MSMNKTCAISSLRSRLVSSLMIRFATSHRQISLQLSAEISFEQEVFPAHETHQKHEENGRDNKIDTIGLGHQCFQQPPKLVAPQADDKSESQEFKNPERCRLPGIPEFQILSQATKISRNFTFRVHFVPE